jgi:hypothetical protein
VLSMPPNVSEYVPASQLLHSTDPAKFLYFPASQLLHATDPTEFLYFPTTHGVQNTPSGPE